MKEYYHANRKKIRGWKRRIRQINVWGEGIKRPYLKFFNKTSDYTYDRCKLYPFYTLEKRHPPLWFYKLIITKFIEAHNEWEKTFNDLNITYDLQIWLYDPSYILSEIICRKVEKKGDIIRYAWESKLKKTFPYDRFANNNVELKQFEWILADEELVTFESELDDEGFTAAELLADGYEKKDSGENGFYYAKKIGDLWIGRKKRT